MMSASSDCLTNYYKPGATIDARALSALSLSPTRKARSATSRRERAKELSLALHEEPTASAMTLSLCLMVMNRPSERYQLKSKRRSVIALWRLQQRARFFLTILLSDNTVAYKDMMRDSRPA